MKKLYYNLAIKLRKEAKIKGKEKVKKETLDEETINLNKEQDQELSIKLRSQGVDILWNTRICSTRNYP